MSAATAITQPRQRAMIFSDPMVRAIQDGRKTQTRRVVNFRPGFEPGGPSCRLGVLDTNGSINSRVDHLGHCVYHAGWAWQTEHGWCNCRPATYAPPAMPGDLLYVREAWRTVDALDGSNATEMAAMCKEAEWHRPWAPIQYEADKARDNWDTVLGHTPGRYRTARFMPKWASRIWPRVTDVRAGRVQDITDDGVDAEWFGGDIPHNVDGFDDLGFCDYDEECSCGDYSLTELFAGLWDSINAKRGFGWDINPWVWCVSFERTDAPTASGCKVDRPR